MGETRCVVEDTRWLLHQQEPSVTRRFLFNFEMDLLRFIYHVVLPSLDTVLVAKGTLRYSPVSSVQYLCSSGATKYIQLHFISIEYTGRPAQLWCEQNISTHHKFAIRSYKYMFSVAIDNIIQLLFDLFVYSRKLQFTLRTWSSNQLSSHHCVNTNYKLLLAEAVGLGTIHGTGSST